jgi:hypothetical protein
MVTARVALVGVHFSLAASGNLTAISRSIDMRVRNSPERMAVVYVM